MAQQWNEIPAPGGKEAVSRTYGVAYRTDVIDVRVRGNGVSVPIHSDQLFRLIPITDSG